MEVRKDKRKEREWETGGWVGERRREFGERRKRYEIKAKKKGGRKETRVFPLAILVKLNIRRFVWFW